VHLLVVLCNAVEGRDDELAQWYTGRHLPDVVGLDGFSAGQVFSADPPAGSPSPPYRYLAVYEVPDADLDRARVALAEAARGRDRDLREGREPAVPHSDAMHPERVTWWFRSISDRVGAPEQTLG
jgi:hypothetical protein